MHSVAW